MQSAPARERKPSHALWQPRARTLVLHHLALAIGTGRDTSTKEVLNDDGVLDQHDVQVDGLQPENVAQRVEQFRVERYRVSCLAGR